MSRWWCNQCQRIADETVCPTCGHRQVSRGHRFRIIAVPHRSSGEVVVAGTLVEDRTPRESRGPLDAGALSYFEWLAREGAEYTPVPAGLPWFDLLAAALLLGSLASVAWLRLHWPGAAALALLLTPVPLLGSIRQFAPGTWQRLREWYRGHRIPRVRRIVILPRDVAQPVGVEVHHPDHWNLPLEGGRVRCHGRWLDENRLFRADRVVPVDSDWQRPIGRPILSTDYQTFGFALGGAGILLVIVALIDGIL